MSSPCTEGNFADTGKLEILLHSNVRIDARTRSTDLKARFGIRCGVPHQSPVLGNLPLVSRANARRGDGIHPKRNTNDHQLQPCALLSRRV